MKTINYYKNRYRKAVNGETKARILNGAYFNLSLSDFEKFIAWQVNFMNNKN